MTAKRRRNNRLDDVLRASRQALNGHLRCLRESACRNCHRVEAEVVEDYFFPQRPVKAGELFPFVVVVVPPMLGKSAVLFVSGAC